MKSPELVSKSVEAILETLVVDAATIQQEPRRTIEPTRAAQDSTTRALSLLRSLPARSSGAGAVAIGSIIGRGGMGEVFEAEQVSMSRSVAVKRLKKDAMTEANTLKLLHEAWVTGYLEHPNIIPVYDITVDETGAPLILLKRIEGVQWGRLMDDPETVRHRFAATDLLEWNLRVLMQVCDAIHFAHSRGIIHRDLKPENIMIGEFGEVYVVDWGIAVSTRDEHEGRIPLAKNARQMAGTPCYMAPEMLGGERSLLGESTDVYLLGAMLFEMLTGDPPHQGNKLQEIISSILQSPPPMPDGVPYELGRIARRAMDADRNARFESPMQFKLAIEGFLSHRGSRQLARHAAQRLRQLLAEVERPDADDTDGERHLMLHNLFAECRFGFHESLKEWPDNAAANEGILRATSAMVEYELRNGDAKAAATLLSGLDSPPAGLRQRVEEAQREKDAEQRRRVALERDNDPRVGARTRLLLGLVMGSLWTLSPVAIDMWLPSLTNLNRESHLGLIYSTAFFLIVGMGFFGWAREALTRTRLNRQLVATVTFALVAQMVMNLVCGIRHLDIADTMILNFFLWFTISGLVNILVERRFWAATLGYFVALFTAAYLPDYRYWIMSASHFVLTVNIVAVWGPTALELFRRGEDPPPYPKLPELDSQRIRQGVGALRDTAREVSDAASDAVQEVAQEVSEVAESLRRRDKRRTGDGTPSYSRQRYEDREPTSRQRRLGRRRSRTDESAESEDGEPR